jgi:hypothetical protein
MDTLNAPSSTETFCAGRWAGRRIQNRIRRFFGDIDIASPGYERLNPHSYTDTPRRVE